MKRFASGWPPTRASSFTSRPPGSSWLNLVESWFSKLTQQRLRRGVFCSVQELVAAIKGYLTHHNADPKPFVWSTTVETILGKIDTTTSVQPSRVRHPWRGPASSTGPAGEVGMSASLRKRRLALFDRGNDRCPICLTPFTKRDVQLAKLRWSMYRPRHSALTHHDVPHLQGLQQQRQPSRACGVTASGKRETRS